MTSRIAEPPSRIAVAAVIDERQTGLDGVETATIAAAVGCTVEATRACLADLADDGLVVEQPAPNAEDDTSRWRLPETGRVFAGP